MTRPEKKNNRPDRRQFLQSSVLQGSVAAAAFSPLLAQGATNVPAVHEGADETLRIGLVGCGGRGTGAVINALTADPQTKLVAIGDTFADRAALCLENIQADETVGSRAKVDPERVFSGFDAYKSVIDSGVDVVILTTPPHFRPQHFAYVVEQGKHCFIEKPIAVDVPGVLSVQKTCEIAKQKGLAVVSGLCWRYDRGVLATMQQIQDGAIGDIIAIESSYNSSTLWHRGDKPEWSRMEYQLRNWVYHNWLSGDQIVEQAIHSLDKTAWLLGDASPVEAVGIGGRQQRTEEKYGNVFDHHVVTYRYANGVPVYFTCRQQDNCTTHVDELVLGTKGKAQILKHRIDGETKWRYREKKPSMYVEEHSALFKSIRNGTPINNGHYMNNSTMIAIMGRMCTYTGQELTWEQVIASEERLGPETYGWTDLPEDEVAIPGVTKFV